MTTRRSIKYRYLKTKMALSQTVQSILDINRKRRFVREGTDGKAALDEELKVLNAVAENLAMALRNYELQMKEAPAGLAPIIDATSTPSNHRVDKL